MTFRQKHSKINANISKLISLNLFEIIMKCYEIQSTLLITIKLTIKIYIYTEIENKKIFKI